MITQFLFTCKRAPVGVAVLDWLVDASPNLAGAVGGALVLLTPPTAACRRDPDAVANPRLRGLRELFNSDCCWNS